VYRDGLRSALSGRDDVTLEPILRFLYKYIADYRFGQMASEVMDVVLGKSSFTKDTLSVPLLTD
jgi:U3 small nucleolar RNA-associated protein 15